MDTLTEAAGHLCGEITALRRERHALQENLTTGSAARRGAVEMLRAEFTRTRATTAQKDKGQRLTFLTGLRRSVADQRQQLQGDLAGARKAWLDRNI